MPSTLIVTTTGERAVSHCGASIWGGGTHLRVLADEFSTHRKTGPAPHATVRLVVPDDHAAGVVRQLAWGATVKRASHSDPAEHARKQAGWLRRLADEIEARDADTVPDGPDPRDRDDAPWDGEDDTCSTP